MLLNVLLLLIGEPILLSAAPTDLIPRDAAIRDSPTGSYVPHTGVDCPQRLAVRRPSNDVRFPFPRQTPLTSLASQTLLNPNETAYVLAKTANSVGDWTTYLNQLGLADLNVSAFVLTAADARPAETLPSIAIAISGGGTRCAMASCGGGGGGGADVRGAGRCSLAGAS